MHAAGLSGTCSSALGHHSQPGSVFSKILCVVPQTFSGSVSADASLQPLSGAKQCSFFNGHVPPCAGRCCADLRGEFLPPCAGAPVLPCRSAAVHGGDVFLDGDDPPPCAGGSHARACLRDAPLPPCAGRRSLNGWWSLSGRLWTKVCNRICSVHSSSDSSDLVTHCCTSGSCAFVVSRARFSCSVRISGVGWWCWWFSGGLWGGCCTGWGGRWAFPLSSFFSSGDGWRCCTWQHQFVVGHGSCMLSHGNVVYQRWGFQSGRTPVSEVEAGVNFRPAGGVRGQVAGSLPGRQPDTGTRLLRGGVDTPSLHPEVPGIQFVSPGRGLGIRQSMGWTKVCGHRTIGGLGAKG